MVKIKTLSGFSAGIDELGAQLCSLSDGKNEYIYNNVNIWKRHAPVLFPFVGRMPNQQYQFNGKSYNVPVHGFAPTSMFEVVEQEEDFVKMRMIINDEVKANYPFDFEFYANYKVSGTTLTETFEVVNKGSSDMFYGFGSHPGFNVPINDKLKFEDYYVEFPEAETLKHRLFDEERLDSGKEAPCSVAVGNKIPLRHNLFDNDAITLTGSGSRAIIKSDLDPKTITVDYPDTPFCALWHMVGMEVPYVCVEPWVSLPGHKGTNDISEKADFVCLKPGCRKEHKLIITIA